ncbi:MAG: hypothetical protein ACJ764_09065, partial [Solirubrobacteraceae bacterium]
MLREQPLSSLKGVFIVSIAPSNAAWRWRAIVAVVGAAVVLLVLGIKAAPALASDGTGTMVVSPTYVVSGSTGNYLDFTYTAGAGGTSNGQITLLVPTGWPAPSPSGFDANGLSVPCEGDGNLPQVTSVSGGSLITIGGVYLNAGSTCDIKYGIPNFNSGVTAPVTTGAYTFTTQEKSTSGGTLTSISGQPVVNVGNDGTGTMSVSPTHVTSGTSGNTLTFTYTATRTNSNGKLAIAVPAGWAAPSTTASAAGATTSNCGTVSISGSTISVSGVNLAVSGSCTVVYGNKASGPGATSPASGGGYTPYTFTAQEEATNDNNLIALASSPQVSVTAPDGSGTMAVSPTKAIQGSASNYFDFTYTAPAGGLSNGQITLLVPTGWPTPSPSGFDANGLSDGCEGDGNLPTVTPVAGGSLITTNGVSLSGGGTCDIRYGISGFNAGVTAPSNEGLYSFTTQVSTWSGGTLTSIS